MRQKREKARHELHGLVSLLEEDRDRCKAKLKLLDEAAAQPFVSQEFGKTTEQWITTVTGVECNFNVWVMQMLTKSTNISITSSSRAPHLNRLTLL